MKSKLITGAIAVMLLLTVKNTQAQKATNENTVVVNKRAYGVKDILSKNGFDVVEVELENGEIFAGGIHCSTLDLVREDEYIEY